jgi:hypothetical protein
MANPFAQVVVLAEEDYCYGRGQLTLRIGQVDYAHPVRYDGDVFYRVQGVQVHWTGAESVDRDVLVRARRLPDPDRYEPVPQPSGGSAGTAT